MDVVKSQVLNISLNNFRNYSHMEFVPSADFIVITGNNGLGKTNILEAVSLLSPGKGLRNAKLDEMINSSNSFPWSIRADISGEYGLSTIVTSAHKDNDHSKREIKIDDNHASQTDLSRILSVSWLVPQMCHIFIDSASARRKLLDRMVSNFDASHVKNLHAYEYHTKERSNLLKMRCSDNDWLNVVERKIAENAVMIATSRVQFVELIEDTVKATNYDLPEFSMRVSGFIEEMVYKMPSVQMEELFVNTLKENREIDFMSKRTNAGIHRSDLLVYGYGGIRADMCSTGQQKFLLMSLFLTEIIAQIRHKSRLPIILLDDVSAHLDMNAQAKFFEIVSDMQAQVWVTSISMKRFPFLKDRSEFLRVSENNLVVI